jgi:hypothetical protein
MQHVNREMRAPPKRTESEALFERFCNDHRLNWEAIPTGQAKTPDYRLYFGGTSIAVEIEQIESTAGFDSEAVSRRTVGAHVRRKINAARGQVRAAADGGIPAILLIHNTIDPLQLFGTEPHDFICAMYGELTVRLIEGANAESFHGLNAKLRPDTKTYFSGVGHLKRVGEAAEVTVFENVYGENRLPFAVMPSCIGVVRVEVEHAA